MSITQTKLTYKQRQRLEEFASAQSPPKVVGWSDELHGPKIQFFQDGTIFVVTKDGGVCPL